MYILVHIQILLWVGIRYICIKVFRDCGIRKSGVVYKQSPVTHTEVVKLGYYKGPNISSSTSLY